MLRDHLCGCAPLPLLFCWWPACRGASVRTNRAERWLQPRRPTTQLSHRECPLRTRRLRRDSRETRRWARPLHRLPVKLRSRARLRPRRWPRRWPRHRIDPRPAVGRPAARESAAFSSGWDEGLRWRHPERPARSSVAVSRRRATPATCAVLPRMATPSATTSLPSNGLGCSPRRRPTCCKLGPSRTP